MVLSSPGPAVGAVLHVDVEDTLEQARPTHAVGPGLNRFGLDFAGSDFADWPL
jgi:hypothetical protein